ncbi:hypothetical protein B0A58_05085 [Flavobacterium branchiophilum NBRC 15030 = ATCC 35035]|uniref:Lipoprotein n=1 Tax=Flavobacterium branchiophilum TaxID=55197 RepID=A0A543G1Z0_9FLAO|nr:hypothetical protein [Flavobacterium branchiophilum]OXA77904.1 hypothetical protein B0A58_05085 [Flavobacterium branchiophilum NBRC 15030 = ATCC 35035]TQM40113.1 hypothetical protein BC670_0980 [Flavobacterium branchiophilum]
MKKSFLLKGLTILLLLTLFGCTTNEYYTTAPTENIGKTNVYIEGNLTDAECAAKLKAEVGTLTENIYIGSALRPLNNVTILELDIPTNVRNIDFSGFYNNLKTIKIKGHGAMPESYLKFYSGIKTENILIEGITELFDVDLLFHSEIEQPATLICNNLEYVHRNFQAGGGYSGGIIANNLVCNDLKYINPNATYTSSYIGIIGVFNTLSFNSLKKVDSLKLELGGGGIVTDIMFPALEQSRGIGVNTMYNNYQIGLNSISFPLITELSTLIISDNFVATVNLPALTKCININLKDEVLPATVINIPNLNNCTSYKSNIKLTSEGVNAVLNRFLTMQPVSGKTINLLNEVAPTGQGLIDKQTLITQGNQVWSN